ncbi:MarR family winged helix-turn-helix transcriptional regulator [Gordonia rhizosphera]|uniref:Putative MarR family transcriptional regulator n=1 Tax=Gordonia rhizosphera NBRC 16068 TaxID=1108045 RepID=K6WKA8_9ACTN|nr:MarR family winged helix-turn-helix transcriptional regulator [Gordonia rhizosphera]GAB92597.1 putative MarR family transcriptional regulator [Gordonia rhizosphera NBRC 16068]
MQRQRQQPITDDLGFLMARVSALLAKSANRALAPLGLKVRAYSVLATVCDQPEGITQRRLAADVGLDPSQIVALVDDLEGRGLVVRNTDPEDRRNKLIVATDAGLELCSQARKITDAAAAQHLVGSDDSEIDTLRAVLSRVLATETS